MFNVSWFPDSHILSYSLSLDLRCFAARATRAFPSVCNFSKYEWPWSGPWKGCKRCAIISDRFCRFGVHWSTDQFLLQVTAKERAKAIRKPRTAVAVGV